MSVVTATVCPIIGCVINNTMFSSPMIAILNARKNNDLGDLNPVPFTVIVLNCIGWCMYGVMLKDYYIFFANAPGVVLGLFFCISSLQLLVKANPSTAEQQSRFIIENMLLFSAGFWLSIGLIVGIILGSGHSATCDQFVGILVDLAALLYYAAPLSTMREIIITRDASSLYAPTILVNLSNATLWIFYGFLGIHNVYVWLPNLLGAMLSLSQLTMILIYGQKRAQERQSEATAGTAMNTSLIKTSDARDSNI